MQKNLEKQKVRNNEKVHRPVSHRGKPENCLSHAENTVRNPLRSRLGRLVFYEKVSFGLITILRDPGAVSRVGRKGGTKVFKYAQKSPWVPALTELFPKINRRTVSPEFFSWVRTRRLLSRSRLVWLMQQRNARSQETFSLIKNPHLISKYCLPEN